MLRSDVGSIDTTDGVTPGSSSDLEVTGACHRDPDLKIMFWLSALARIIPTRMSQNSGSEATKPRNVLNSLLRLYSYTLSQHDSFEYHPCYLVTSQKHIGSSCTLRKLRVATRQKYLAFGSENGPFRSECEPEYYIPQNVHQVTEPKPLSFWPPRAGRTKGVMMCSIMQGVSCSQAFGPYPARLTRRWTTTRKSS